MAVDIFNSTTLSAAITDDAGTFTVAATTNITAGDLLVIRDELIKVNAVPVSGTVNVSRGWEGTEARAHANSQRVFIIDSDDNTENIKKNTKQQLALVGATGTYPDFLFPGQRATDGQGNEYVMVELTAVCYSGTTVMISVDGNYTAVQAAGGSQGAIGLTVEAATSDQYTWAQIYGYNAYAQDTIGDSGASSATIPVPATSVTTPSVGLTYVAAGTTVAAYIIHGMHIVGADSSAVTSATSSTGTAMPVFLNYPYIVPRVEALDSSGS